MKRLLFAAVAALIASTAVAAKPRTLTAPPPGIILIITDDQTQQMVTGQAADGSYLLPFITSKKGSARKFQNLYFPLSLCTPSRASILTGMYPHNHGVLDNAGADGGYAAFDNNGLAAVSWPAVLQTTHYTGLFGKLMNGYNSATYNTTVPAGFNRWFGQVDGVLDMFTWRANADGVMTQFTDNGSDDTYMTDVLARHLVAEVNRQGAVYTKPFAFIFSPPAPHEPSIPAREFDGLYVAEPFEPGTKASFNEANVLDKNLYGETRPLLGPLAIANTAAAWRHRLESARSIDKAFQTIWEGLEAKGLLDNAFIVFMPDNGEVFGEHRLTKKIAPYLENIRSTMYVWGPGVAAGTDPSIVTNADLFPTFAEIAGLPIPAYVDGRSLLARWQGAGGAARRTLYVRGIPPKVPDDVVANLGWTFDALAAKDGTHDSTYINYGDDHEYYDHLTDPLELTNKWGTTTGTFRNASQARIDALKACAGRAQCQPLEDATAP